MGSRWLPVPAVGRQSKEPMKLITNPAAVRAILPACAVWLMLVALTGCTSKPQPTPGESTASQVAVAPQNNFNGGTYCVQKFLEGPAPVGVVHFSNKVTESDPSLKTKDFETDLAGDTADQVHTDRWLATDEDRKFFDESRRFTDPKLIDRKIDNGIAEETVRNHAARSDQVNWRGVIVSVAQGGTPWGLFLYKPPVTRVGNDNVSGYAVTKYVVDTRQQSAAEKAAGMLRNLKDYDITGTAWALQDGSCVLQYDLTDTQIRMDGKTETTHYEGSVTKK